MATLTRFVPVTHLLTADHLEAGVTIYTVVSRGLEQSWL